MEYWIFFDLASGAELWRGSGSAGTAALQQVPEGAGMAVVPQAVISGPTVNLPLLRAAVWSDIDTAAERVRCLFLTPGAGQAMTYTRKESEARAWVADNGAATPFLVAEATARGMSVAELAAEVIAQADAWVTIGAAIEARRMAAKGNVAAADTIGGIITAQAIDWSAIGAAASA
ncbi:hypothetical protein QP166_14565 [Sphingomonas sp. LR60]|uniref:hypothetical protein n=1 Tax=Sphingomonas sp. LR60 TaxID=3050233 RepID=UPI002FE33779